MKLRHLKIERFRGLRSLSWYPQDDFICLVGPGDSGKSTILDAIQLVFSPRWNPAFDDADFYGASTDDPIEIDATIGELPRRLLSDAHFGLRLRGYLPSPPTLHDEPEDDDEEVITIRLSVDSSLEPTWRVVTDRHEEGVPISAKERERLGVTRLGAVVNRDLSWSKGSVLSRLTGEVDGYGQVLAEANRTARRTVDPDELKVMSDTASEVGRIGRRLGVQPQQKFNPRIDPAGGVAGVGLALHDGQVPARLTGFGTRRLLSFAMQWEVSKDGGVILVDEVEHGLEPYRLRRLLRELIPSPEATEARDDPDAGAVILTTHSPITLGELRARHLRVVRTAENETKVLQPSTDAQGSLITHAEAFLSRKVIVCEGRTELGLLQGLDEAWSQEHGPLAVHGVGLADGGGVNKVAAVARDFRQLEYPTAILADSDRPLEPSSDDLEQQGIVPVLWDGEMATEQRVFLDLPWEAVVEAVHAALDADVPVREQLRSELGGPHSELDGPPEGWRRTLDEDSLRTALGEAAKSKNKPWFKSVKAGEQLGRIIGRHLHDIPTTDLAHKLNRLKGWVST